MATKYFGSINRQDSKMLLSMKKQLSRFEVKGVRGLNDSEKKSRGSGSYGVVYEVTVSGVPRIAKQLHQALMQEDTIPEHRQALFKKFYEECELLSTLDHPNIVKFVGIHFGAKWKEFDISLVMEKLQFDLDKFLSTHPNFPLHEKLSILLDVSNGLLFLHNREPPIIHRDLSTGNILLSENMEAKIADFGVSRVLNINPNALAQQTKCPGTLAYMPPEAKQEIPKYGTALDVFSFGHVCLCVIHQTFTEVVDVTNSPDLPVALERGEIEILKRKRWFDKMPANKGLQEIVTSCLRDEPAQRLSTSQLKEKLTNLCVQDWKKVSEELITLKQELPKLIEGATQRQHDNVQKLMSQNTELQQKNQNLTEKLEQIMAEKNTLGEQNDLLKQEFIKLHSDTKLLNADFKQLSQSIEHLTKGSTEVVTRLQESGSHNEHTRRQLTRDCSTHSMDERHWAQPSHEFDMGDAIPRTKSLNPIASRNGDTLKRLRSRAQHASTEYLPAAAIDDKNELKKITEMITRHKLPGNSTPPDTEVIT